MRYTGHGVTWVVTGGSEDREARNTVVEGDAPDGQDALELTVDPSAPLGAREERVWPVEEGRGYLLSAQIKTALSQAYGRLQLIWLDGAGVALSSVLSPVTFGTHDYAPMEIWALAPVGAVQAQAGVLLEGVRRQAGETGGTLRLGPAVLSPSLMLDAKPRATGGLFDNTWPIEYAIALRGGPDDVRRATLHYALTDYSERAIVEGSQAVSLLGGQGRTTLKLEALSAGYYELALEIAAEGIAPMRSVQTFGCLEPLDFDPPHDYPITLDAGLSWPFEGGMSARGPELNLEHLETRCATCSRLGLRALRDRMRWGDVNPEPGVYDWGQYQRATEAQAAAGLEVYTVFHDTPGWAQMTRAQRIYGNYPPRDMRVMYRFAQRLVMDLGDAMRYLEIWNEPDIHFFGGHPWDLAAMTKAAYLGAKDVDPSFGVLGGSRCAGPEFWRKLLANGAGPYIDIWNQHSYAAPEGQFEMIQEDRDLMSEVGIQRPIWMTEMGQRSTPQADGSYTIAERVQVSYLLRAYACGLAAGLDRFFYFYLQEFLEYGGHLWGMQRSDLTPKPAMVALGAMIRQLRDAVAVGYTQQGGCYCVVFERQPDDYVGIAWSIKGSPIKPGWGVDLPEFGPGQSWSYAEGSLDLPLREGAFLINPVGEKLCDLEGDRVNLELSLEPVFVRGLDVARMALQPVSDSHHFVPSLDPVPAERYVWLQAITRPDEPLDQARAQAEKTALFTDGAAEELALVIHNYSDTTAQVELALHLPEDWRADPWKPGELTLPPQSVREVRVRYTPHALQEDQEYAVRATLALNGQPNDAVEVYYVAKG